MLNLRDFDEIELAAEMAVAELLEEFNLIMQGNRVNYANQTGTEQPEEQTNGPAQPSLYGEAGGYMGAGSPGNGSPAAFPNQLNQY